jgi:hypothetical protein
MDLIEVSGIEHTNQPTTDWIPTDTDGDGMITGADIPFEPGSLAAKMAFKKVAAIAHSPEAITKGKSGISEISLFDASGFKCRYGGEEKIYMCGL